MTRRINPGEKSGELELPKIQIFPYILGKFSQFSPSLKILTVMFADRVLYARKGEDVTSQAVTLGGDKISVEDAIVSSNFALVIVQLSSPSP